MCKIMMMLHCLCGEGQMLLSKICSLPKKKKCLVRTLSVSLPGINFLPEFVAAFVAGVLTWTFSGINCKF